MSSAESVMSGEPSDPALSPQDIRFSMPDRQAFQAALANVFNDPRSVERILRATTYDRGRIPSFEHSTADEVWGEILIQLDFGAIPAGNFQLLRAVIGPYPYHQVFRRLADTYLLTVPRRETPAAQQADNPEAQSSPQAQPAPEDPATPPGTPGPSQPVTEAPEAQAAQRNPEPRETQAPLQMPPSGQSQTAREPEQPTTLPDSCHVIVRASTEEIREQATQVLRELGLDPVEHWSTAHAVSFRVNLGSPSRVLAQLDRTNFGWTVVPPGVRDYLFHSLFIEGPDGRQFRITDAPAQQTVSNVAAEVIDQYGKDLPDAGRPAVVDKVGPDGQGHRLDPNATLDEAQVRDGDRMRVGFQARAAAVNPLDRQDALYRVFNQIRQFGNARDPGANFVVLSNSVLLPTEYELEFTQPSFGPPPSPESPPTDVSRHRVLIQLPSDFPTAPPLVFWLTAIYHPNVFPTYECELTRGRETQMGLVCLGALQESYLPSLHFGSLCQLLMDIAGFRNYSLFKPAGSMDPAGVHRMQADYFDPGAAAWVASPDGQRRITEIKGSPLGEPPWQHHGYPNVIERTGAE